MIALSAVAAFGIGYAMCAFHVGVALLVAWVSRR